jgi:hypothetical protein
VANPTVVNVTADFAAAGVTFYEVDLTGNEPSAGNLVVLCASGDKNISSFGAPTNTTTTTVGLFDTSVSLVVAWYVAAGTETAINGTVGANIAGANLVAVELEQAGTTGVWTVCGSATDNTDESNVTVWQTGTTGTITREAIAIAAFSKDSVNTAGTVGYTNSYTSEFAQTNGGTPAGIWVASLPISSGTTSTQITLTGGTADQMSGAVVVFGKRETLSASAGHASGTGTAFDPTVSVQNGDAQAGHASGTGAAHQPSLSIDSNISAGHAAGTGAAGEVNPNVRPNAGHASGTGAAHAPTLDLLTNASAGHASGTGTALQPTVSTVDPVGVPFLLAQLSGARLAVEAAFGADLAADDATWDWTDISDDVRYRDRITLRHGRSDEASTSQPASCKLTLDNRSGDYSRGGQSSNWPYIRLNTPVRVSIDPDGGGASYTTVFFGFADSWQPSWDVTGTDATVELSASGTLRRLAQGVAPVVSPFRRAMLDRADLIAYWPCEETKGGQTISSGITGGQDMSLTGSGEHPYPKFAESDVFPCSLPLPEVNLTTWRGVVPTYTATNEVQLRFLAAFPSDALSGTFCTVASVFTAGSLVRWDIVYVNAGGGSLQLHVTDTTGTRTQLTFNDFNCNDTIRWYHLGLAQNGADVDWTLSTIGLGYTDDGGAFGTVTTDTITRATAVAIAPDGDGADLILGHVAVMDTLTSFTGDLDVFNAYEFETAGDRITRLCAEAGVAVTITGTSDIRMGPQSIDRLVPLLRECETVDGGLLFDGLANGLSYIAGAERVNAAASLTLDASAGEVGELEPIDDDQRTRNKVTAKRTSGGEATYEDTDGELGTAAVGVYDDSVSVNSLYVDDLVDQASRRVALGTLPGYRYPHLRLALHRDSALVDEWLATVLSDRVDVTNIDDVRTQHPDGTVSLLLEGTAQVIDQFLWDVTMNTSPYEPMRAGLYAADAAGGGEFVLRVDSDGSTLNSSALAGATSLSVATPSGPLWVRTSQRPNEFPFDIEVGGIKVTVTACTGSTSPQTFTVTGSTVTKALTSGSTVALWRPLGPGM